MTLLGRKLTPCCPTGSARPGLGQHPAVAPEEEEVSALPPQERPAGLGRVRAGSGPAVQTRGFPPASRLLSGRLSRLPWGRTHRHCVHLVKPSQAWSAGWGSAPILGSGEILWGPNSEAKLGPGSKESKGAQQKERRPGTAVDLGREARPAEPTPTPSPPHPQSAPGQRLSSSRLRPPSPGSSPGPRRGDDQPQEEMAKREARREQCAQLLGGRAKPVAVGSPRLFQEGRKCKARPSLWKPLGCFKKTQEAPEGLACLAPPGGTSSPDSGGTCITSLSGVLPGDQSGHHWPCVFSALGVFYFFSFYFSGEMEYTFTILKDTF